MDSTKLHLHKKKTWFLLLTFSLLLSTLLIIISLTSTSSTFSLLNYTHSRTPKPPLPQFVESKLHVASTSLDPVPRLAYLISGSAGDGVSLLRTLKALYHPRNQYAVHLDLEASAEERLEVARFVESEPVFRRVGNVRMVTRANLVTYRGPTMVTNTLHSAAFLFKEGGDWDWFINLSASDYPLICFIHCQLSRETLISSNIPVTLDGRSSAWMMLSRPFIEYCLWGWDSLTRIVMYYANFLSSPEGYFHTVICNAKEFRNTTVNHDLHFISWDNPPKQHPHFLTLNDYRRMVDSNVPFARKFGKNDPVLDKIDSELLGCNADGFVRGGWFNNEGNSNITLAHHIQTNTTELRPGPGVGTLKHLINGLLSSEDFHAKQCS